MMATHVVMRQQSALTFCAPETVSGHEPGCDGYIREPSIWRVKDADASSARNPMSNVLGVAAKAKRHPC